MIENGHSDKSFSYISCVCALIRDLEVLRPERGLELFLKLKEQPVSSFFCSSLYYLDILLGLLPLLSDPVLALIHLNEHSRIHQVP